MNYTNLGFLAAKTVRKINSQSIDAQTNKYEKKV